MISINVMGGLGNQLFMIFATLAYGIQHNVKVVFPEQNCYYDPNRPTYWDTFLPELKIFTTENPENQVSEEQRKAFVTYGEQGFGYRPFPDFGSQCGENHKELVAKDRAYVIGVRETDDAYFAGAS